MKYESLAIHGGRKETTAIKPVNYPLYLSSTFTQASLSEFGDFMYSRSNNPTRNNVEQLVAQLENAQYALAMASGMAATALVFDLLKPGDKVLLNTNVYGGTWCYVAELFEQKQIKYEIVTDFNTYDFTQISPDVRMIFLETPSNPLLEITDIALVCQQAKQHDVMVVVDNTFLTSYYQKPLELGADIVVYSATKYYAGHSDIIAGLVVCNDDALYATLKLRQKILGAILSPFDSFLLTRGIKTLALRMERHQSNTKAMAKFLAEHPAVEKVFYPGLASNPGFAIQRKQSQGDGAVLSFRLKENYDIEAFCLALKFFDLAVSLGGVESLICHPASMTHETYSKALQQQIGITDNLLRLSIGIEHIDDLLADVESAFRAAAK